MSDTFRIIPYVVRSAGTDVPPEEVQAAVNSLAQQTTIALNSVASDPTGPAGGDLGGTYPNPTVVSSHITSGTMSGVAVTGGTINNAPIGQTTPAAGAFTTAVAGSVFANGGAVPAVTATGTQVYNSPNPTVQFIDSVRSANNKNAFITWGSTVLAFGFANDAFTGFTNALTITGGQVAGISGITSTSGTGAWAHTGGFSATGGINSTAVGATTPSTGAFTTLSSSGTASLNNVTLTTALTVANGGTGRATLTAHGVLLGEGTAAINQTSAGTAGQALVSGGASADPAFATLGVNGGGTGATTLTAHGVLLGEGTGAVVATAVGTTGQALIGQTGADPIFGFPTGALINVQVFTASGTYTATTGTNSVIVEVQAPGGGGGGVSATGAAQAAIAQGGSAGAYVKARITSAFSGVTVTIGAAGTGGAAGTNSGTSGGTTSFGALISCPGGTGGAGSAAQTAGFVQSGAGPTAAPTTSGVTVLISSAGQKAAPGVSVGTGAVASYGGYGFMGLGSDTGNGAGGDGAVIAASASATAGQNASPGRVLVFEYA